MDPTVGMCRMHAKISVDAAADKGVEKPDLPFVTVMWIRVSKYLAQTP